MITEELIRHQARRAMSVTIEVGNQSSVIPEALQTAFAVAVRETEFRETALIIHQVEGRVLDIVKIEVEDAATYPGSSNQNSQR